MLVLNSRMLLHIELPQSVGAKKGDPEMQKFDLYRLLNLIAEKLLHQDHHLGPLIFGHGYCACSGCQTIFYPNSYLGAYL